MSRITTVGDTDWLRAMLRVDAIGKGNSQCSILEDVEWLHQMLAICHAQCAVCRRTNDQDYRVLLRVVRDELLGTYRNTLWSLYALSPSDDDN